MTSSASLPVLDRMQLRGIAMGDEQLMRDLLATLIDDTRLHLSPLSDALERRDAVECIRLAHYCKGACDSLGAAAAAAALRTMERHAASGDFDSCRKTLGVLTAELQTLSREAEMIRG